MPLIPEVYQATDDRMMQFTNGMNAFFGGALYLQYGSTTALANSTTETTLFNNTPNNIAAYVFGQNLGQPNDISSLTIVGNPNGIGSSLSGWIPGTMYRIKLYGSIGNTGTPTLRIRTVLRNSNSNAIVYTISDSTALTMSTITGTGDFQYECDVMAVSIGSNAAGTFTLGSVKTRALLDYAISTVSRGFLSTPWTTTAIDTTQPYYFDVLATWGTASSSNTITTQVGLMRAEG